jgi:hypothetical protein
MCVTAVDNLAESDMMRGSGLYKLMMSGNVQRRRLAVMQEQRVAMLRWSGECRSSVLL